MSSALPCIRCTSPHPGMPGRGCTGQNGSVRFCPGGVAGWRSRPVPPGTGTSCDACDALRSLRALRSPTLGSTWVRGSFASCSAIETGTTKGPQEPKEHARRAVELARHYFRAWAACSGAGERHGGQSDIPGRRCSVVTGWRSGAGANRRTGEPAHWSDRNERTPVAPKELERGRWDLTRRSRDKMYAAESEAAHRPR